MEKKAATQIVQILLDCSGAIDQSVAVAKQASPAEEFEEFRISAGRIMGSIFFDLLRPIFTEYPDLEPEELRRP